VAGQPTQVCQELSVDQHAIIFTIGISIVNNPPLPFWIKAFSVH